MNKDFSPLGIFKKAWGVFKGQMKVLGTLWIVVAVINIILSSSHGKGDVSFIVSIISYAFGVISTYAITRSSLMAVRGEVVTKDSILTFSWVTVGWLAVSSVLYGLIVGIGTVFLIIPGVILAIKFFPITYSVVDEKLDTIDGFKRASELTKGHGWDLFLVGVITVIATMIVVILTAGIAGLIIMPANILIGAVIYDILRNYSIPEKKEGELPAKTA